MGVSIDDAEITGCHVQKNTIIDYGEHSNEKYA